MTAPFWAAETPQRRSLTFRRRGEVTVGTKCAEGDGIFALEIRWQTQSCSITPVLLEGAEEEAESLTVEEAVHFLEEMPPERLGLSGSDMSSYLLFPEEGS